MNMLLTGSFRNVMLLAFLISIFCLNARAEALEGEDYSRHELVIHTVDNVSIKGSLFDGDNEKVIIYCHQLLGSQSGEEVTQLLGAFIDEYDLITFNFRGHKSSGWVTTTGGDEVLDLHAVISFAVKKGYRKIVVLGAGMGSSVAVRTAGLFRNIDALIVVSPSGFSPELQSRHVRIVTDIALNTDFGRVPIRILTNTRLGKRYTAGYPIDIISEVSPIPLLVIQSEKDRYLSSNRMCDAFDHASEPKSMVLIPGSLHANKLLIENTLIEIKNWLRDLFFDYGYESSTLLEKDPISSDSDSIQVFLSGDLPIPEELIIRAFNERLAELAGTSGETEIYFERIPRILEDVLSFHGYSMSKVTFSDSTLPFKLLISVPRVHAVSIQGNKHVSEDYIRRLLKIEGGYFNSYELDIAIRRLSSEPSIRTVTSDVTVREDGEIGLQLTVVEQRPYRLLLATKFTDLDQFYSVGFSWNEFNPSGIQLVGAAMVGVSDRAVHPSFSVAKKFWGRSVQLQAKYFDTIKSRDDMEYVYTRQEVHEVGGELSASYQMTATMRAQFGVFGKDYKSPEVTSGFVVQEGTTLGNSLKLDVRGKLPLQGFPRFLWRSNFYHQNFGLGSEGDFNFNTYQLNLSGDLKLWRQHRSVTTFHYGWISGEAPPQEHFSLGGMTTLPGYPDDQFVNTNMARASQALYLCASSWVAETSLLEPFRLIFTANAGTVWEDDKKFEASDLKMDLGFELDYMEVIRLGFAAPIGSQSARSLRVYIGWGTHVF